MDLLAVFLSAAYTVHGAGNGVTQRRWRPILCCRRTTNLEQSTGVNSYPTLSITAFLIDLQDISYFSSCGVCDSEQRPIEMFVQTN